MVAPVFYYTTNETVCRVIVAKPFTRLPGAIMNKTVILVGLILQILGVLLLVSRMMIPQFGLIAMGVWFLAMGVGFLLYANAPKSDFTIKRKKND